jgi:hypothetical protein
MARPENESARKSPPWLESYDLDTFKGVDNFTKELLKLSWTGDLGTRQSSNCLGVLRLLLERRLWLPTSSDRLNPEIGRYGQPSPEKGEEQDSDVEDSPPLDQEQILTAFVNQLPKELHDQILEYVRHQAKLEEGEREQGLQ